MITFVWLTLTDCAQVIPSLERLIFDVDVCDENLQLEFIVSSKRKDKIVKRLYTDEYVIRDSSLQEREFQVYF